MPTSPDYTLTDIWGRTINVFRATMTYVLADGSISLQSTSDAEALQTFNSMEPAADYVSPK